VEAYLPILRALAGIGADARDAVPVVARLVNSEVAEVRHAAVHALAKIDRGNRSLVRHLRRWLTEWQRQSQQAEYAFASDNLEWLEFAEALREIGPRAEPLAADLNRLTTTSPLANPELRCYAAYALATFPAHKQAAVDYLEAVRNRGFFQSFEFVNLADDLLHRIAGVEQPWTHLSQAHGVGP
jgi:hypothetical protein